MNIRHFFHSIMISDEVGIKKPDKRIFEKTLNELQVKAEETLIVGDQPVNDIQGAEAAGIKAVWLRKYITDKMEEGIR